MSLLSSIKMASNQAFAPIMAGLRQAHSYSRGMGRLGLDISKQVVTHATSNGLLMKAGIGAGIGAATGAGYGATEDRATAGSIIRAGMGGAVIGGAFGASYGIGRSARALSGSSSMLDFAAQARVVGRGFKSAYTPVRQAQALGGGMLGGFKGIGRDYFNAAAGSRVGRAINSGYGRAAGAVRDTYNRVTNITPPAQGNLF